MKEGIATRSLQTWFRAACPESHLVFGVFRGEGAGLRVPRSDGFASGSFVIRKPGMDEDRKIKRNILVLDFLASL